MRYFIILLSIISIQNALHFYGPVQANPYFPKHICIHDSLEMPLRLDLAINDDGDFLKSNSFSLEQNETLSMAIASGGDWEPLRIVPIFYIDNNQDELACTRQGDKKKGPQSDKEFVCNSRDVLDSRRKSIIENIITSSIDNFKRILHAQKLPDTLNDMDLECGNLKVRLPLDIDDIKKDAHFVLIVTAHPIRFHVFDDDALAFARPCSSSVSSRPTLGWVNFEPHKIEINPDLFSYQQSVAMHEITHSLGFNFNTFIGLKMIGQEFRPPGGNPKIYIKTPRVREFVREHFDCPTLKGAYLEDSSQEGTGLSHWEKSIFMNEYMTGSAIQNARLTALTMLTLQDTGWYTASIDNLDNLDWGYKEGCDMASTFGCSKWPQSYHCSPDQGRSSCSHDFRSFGMCVIESSDSLINPGCTYWGSHYSCSNGKILDSPVQSPISSIISAGDSVNQHNSICFDSSLFRLGNISDIIYFPSTSKQRCYLTKCISQTELLVIVEGLYYTCDIEGSTISLSGYAGKIICPKDLAKTICRNEPYDETWPRLTKFDIFGSDEGISISVSGTGLIHGARLIVDTDCINLIEGDNTISGTIVTSDKWTAASNLNLLNPTTNVIYLDKFGRGYSLPGALVFTVNEDESAFKKSISWVKHNLLIFCAILFCLLLLTLVTSMIFIKRTRRRRQEKLRLQHASTQPPNPNEAYRMNPMHA